MTTIEFLSISIDVAFESYKTQKYRKVYYAYLDKASELLWALRNDEKLAHYISRMIGYGRQPKDYIRKQVEALNELVREYEMERISEKIEKNLKFDSDFWDALNDFCDNYGK